MRQVVGARRRSRPARWRSRRTSRPRSTCCRRRCAAYLQKFPDIKVGIYRSRLERDSAPGDGPRSRRRLRQGRTGVPRAAVGGRPRRRDGVHRLAAASAGRRRPKSASATSAPSSSSCIISAARPPRRSCGCSSSTARAAGSSPSSGASRTSRASSRKKSAWRSCRASPSARSCATARSSAFRSASWPMPRRTLMIYREQGYLSDSARELIKIVRAFNWEQGFSDKHALRQPVATSNPRSDARHRAYRCGVATDREFVRTARSPLERMASQQDQRPNSDAATMRRPLIARSPWTGAVRRHDSSLPAHRDRGRRRPAARRRRPSRRRRQPPRSVNHSRRRRRAAPTRAAGRSRRSSSAAPSSSTAPAHRRSARSTSSSRAIASSRSAAPARPDCRCAANRAPQNADLEVDATGMYVMPGFVSLHEHAGGAPKNPDAEYPYKLWLAHGVTTVRGVPLTDHALTVSERERSNRNEIVAPRHHQLSASGRRLGQGRGRHARSGARVGALGRGERPRGPEARRAAAGDHGGAARRGEEAQPRLDRAPAADRRRADERARPPRSSGCRRSRTSTVTSKRCSRTTSCSRGPVDQINDDEQMRFGQVARLWDKIHAPGSPEWKAYLAGAPQARTRRSIRR